jgi:transposase-like protein
MDASRNRSESEQWQPPRGRRWSRQDAEQMAVALRASGLSAARFAKQHGLNGQRVYWWMAQLGGGAARAAKTKLERRPRFVPVRVVESSSRSKARPTPREPAGLEIHVGSSTVIRVRRGFDNELLRSVVAALAEGSC